MFNQRLRERLKYHAAENLVRERMVLTSPQQVELQVEGRPILSFCSNDYLGLACDPRVVAALQKGAELYGVGSGASQLISGHFAAHRDLENHFARFLQRDRALFFNNGYMANIGVLQALTQKNDVIFEDKFNHASLIDAGLLSPARMFRYAHHNLEHLETLLAPSISGQKFIVTDGVFSMGGDLAPLPELVALAKKYDACLVVDDAHGIGVLGQGQGIVKHFNLSQEDVPVLICPLGKAFGGFGAIVAGSDLLIDGLLQFSRTYIYTTALPPAVAYAMQTSLSIIEQEPWRYQHLQELIGYFKEQARAHQLAFLNSETAIQSLIVGDACATIALQDALKAQGLLVGGIRPPTVPKNTGRLRITLSAVHTKAHIDRLLKTLSHIRRDTCPPL